MAKFGKVTFTGESGRDYAFVAYSRDSRFKPIAAVYVITKRRANRKGPAFHTRIYVGQTDNLRDPPLNPDREDCFERRHANCMCVFPEDDQDRRLAIETDLRRVYDPPCNRQ